MSRPVTNLSMHPRQAGTSPAPTRPVPRVRRWIQRGQRRGRACPVPCRTCRCTQDGRGQAPPLRGPCRESAGGFSAGNVGDGLVPSRAEPVDAPKTGGDKPRPYEARAESVGGFSAGNVGDGLVPSRAEPVDAPDGREQAPPLRGPCRESAGGFSACNVGDGLVPSRAEPVDALKTGGDKPRPRGPRRVRRWIQRAQRRGRACPVP